MSEANKTPKENGVDTAIQSIYRDLEYAKSLIKRRDGKTPDDNLEDSEESWTFIGEENDPELVRRWEGMAQSGTLAKHQKEQEEMAEEDDSSDSSEIRKELEKEVAASDMAA